MMKTIRNIVVTFLIIFVLGSTNVFAGELVNGVKFTVNRNVICKDLYVYIDNGELLVPIRGLYKSGKYNIIRKVDEIVICRGFVCVRFFINDNRVVVNDEEKILKTYPQIINNRLYIPFEILENALNNEVSWNEDLAILDVIEDPMHTDEGYNRLDIEEELCAKKFAMSFCDVNLKFLERATIAGSECYVFAQSDDEDNLIAVDRKCKRIYSVVRNDVMYKDAVVIYNN